jgi:hypothetical protein
MKTTLMTLLGVAGLLLSMSAAQALTVVAIDRSFAMHSDVSKIASCVGGRRCRGYYTNARGVRVCRAWIACN